MACWMEAENNGRFFGMFEPDAMGADRNTPVGSDFEDGPHTPDIRPPGTARGGSQNGSFLFPGQIPGSLRREFEFAMRLHGIAVESQGLDVDVGFGHLCDLLTGEIGRQPFLPELVFAFDFAFGLRGWSIKETNVVEAKSRAQLGQSVRGFGEENGVIIDIELQRPAVGQEGGGQEVQVGEQEFPIIEFGADEKAAAIVEHVEHGKVPGAEREPVVRRSVQLPEFADLRALPAAHRSQGLAYGSAVGMAVLQRPVAYLGPVELEVVEAQSLRSDEAVRARGRASQALGKEIDHGLRPGWSVVAARLARCPDLPLLVSASLQVTAEENVKATAREAELVRRLNGGQGALPKVMENMPDERTRVPMQKLLILFRAQRIRDAPAHPASLFVRRRYAPASSKTGRMGSAIDVSGVVVLLC